MIQLGSWEGAMSKNVSPIMWGLAIVLALAACAPAPAPSQSDSQTGGEPSAGRRAGSETAAQQKELVVIVRGEPPSLAAKPISAFSGSLQRPREIFNAMLDFRDENGVPQAQLAEALPQLNTATWRVFPDGRMETTYRLKPNLTWHDGTPLSGEDFAFAWRVYAAPEFGAAATLPIGPMEEVTAPDPGTVVIRWKQPYPDAGSLDRDFQALPRHILETPFRDMDPIAFASQPFWTSEYVGLGPYRVTGWEPGTHISARAFEGYVLGKPKIDRVRVLFISDPQTALANVLSGEVHLIADPIFGVVEGQTLEQQWAANKGGVVLYSPVGPRTAVIQMRPEYVDAQALLDARVRSAIGHGMDTPSAIEILTAGKALATFSITHPRSRNYPEVERAIVKHDYNPRRAQQILDEAGYRKGADGFYLGADGRPIQFGLYSSAGERQEAEVSVYVDSLRQVGFDAVQKVTSVQETRDARLRALLGGIQMRGGGDTVNAYTTEQIPRPENRWFGDNRGGWSNAEYDRLVGLYVTTLEPAERVKILAQAERIRSEDAAVLPRQFNAYVVAFAGDLNGPVARNVLDSGDTFLHVQKWEWRS